LCLEAAYRLLHADLARAGLVLGGYDRFVWPH
jgi:hypothetical protein